MKVTQHVMKYCHAVLPSRMAASLRDKKEKKKKDVLAQYNYYNCHF